MANDNKGRYPRTKYDPKPWTDGFFRYHAWELYAADDE